MKHGLAIIEEEEFTEETSHPHFEWHPGIAKQKTGAWVVED